MMAGADFTLLNVCFRPLPEGFLRPPVRRAERSPDRGELIGAYINAAPLRPLMAFDI